MRADDPSTLLAVGVASAAPGSALASIRRRKGRKILLFLASTTSLKIPYFIHDPSVSKGWSNYPQKLGVTNPVPEIFALPLLYRRKEYAK
jgi:hypothetical protein